jgi:hypothetical protein
MFLKRRLTVLAVALVLGGATLWGAISYLPLNILPIQQKPEQAPQQVYDYYQIIDVESGETLMYIPLVASVGDELLTEENKRYQVVRVEENRAYARFVEYVDIEKYKQQPK